MAKKKSFLGTLIKLGGLAAAGYAVYTRREEIKSFVLDAAERIFPETSENQATEDILDIEPEVIIDTAVKTASEETEESAPEA